MKFLCDRCKTRYSIGDDRVRGKILKIRCKNCANVITVREGMTVDEDPRRGRPTTAAPMNTVGPQLPVGALATAFAQQLAKPPPALQEEWYVSIDGSQAGPFGLAEAQSWVAARSFDAELHCWSEGFDDWLPVDKVSHFRGLRRKPATQPAPASPAGGAPSRPRAPQEEPKPLFAATMATLEKQSSPPPVAVSLPSSPAPAKPSNGMTAKTNGSAAIAPRLPAGSKTNGTGPSPGQAALAAAFDMSPASDTDETVDAEPFKGLRAPALATPEASPPDEDTLDIGEVSRVVNLADLARSANRQKTAASAPRAIAARPSPARLPTAIPKYDAGHGGLDATASIEALPPPPPPESLAAAPVVAQAHRRGLIMLIGVAAVLLAGVTVAVVLMLNQDTVDDPANLGPTTRGIDTSRPDEVVRAHMVQSPDNPTGPTPRPIRHTQQLQPHTATTGPETPDVPGAHLKAEEIEDMAQKSSTATQRCYMRAQRGEMGLELGDLKKITVSLVVDKTGMVTEVQLSDHGGDSLGACLSTQIKRWKFRESSGGQFRIVLAFANN